MRKISLVFSVILLPLLSAPAASMVECKAELPANRTGHWSWRDVEGKRCWYPGRRGLDKAMLKWPRSAPPETTATTVTTATTDGRSSEVLRDEALPELHSYKVKELSFEDRWPR